MTQIGNPVRVWPLLPVMLLAGLAAAGACRRQDGDPRGGPGPSSPERRDQASDLQGRGPANCELILMAAASTRDAVQDAAAGHPTGCSITLVTGGSSTLAHQVIEGAPADLLLSASERWAEALNSRGLAAEIRPLLSNRLVLVVPEGNPAKIRVPGDLLNPAVSRVALAGSEVPAGMYAEQALRGAGVYEPLQASQRIARGSHVRVALGYVESGEAEAGVVYQTDARLSTTIEVVHVFDERTHEPIVYPLVLLRTSGQPPPQARALFDHLAGPQAAEAFKRHGFTVLPGR